MSGNGATFVYLVIEIYFGKIDDWGQSPMLRQEHCDPLWCPATAFQQSCL